MRALTLWPENAWAVCHLGKDVENRPYPPPDGMLGQLMAIHAGRLIGGKTTCWTPNAVEAIGRVMDMAALAKHGSYIDWPRKSVEFKHGDNSPGKPLSPWKILKVEELSRGAVVAVARVADMEWRSPWAADGRKPWFLSSVKVLEKPVPCRGYQRLWTLPPEVEVEVRRQYELLGGELH